MVVLEIKGEKNNCKRVITQTYLHIKTHGHVLSERCLTDADFYHHHYFNHSIAGRAHKQSQRGGVLGLT